MRLASAYPLHEPRLELCAAGEAGFGDDSNPRKMVTPCASMANERRDDKGVRGNTWSPREYAELLAPALER